MCWTQKFSFSRDPVILDLKLQLAKKFVFLRIFMGKCFFFNEPDLLHKSKIFSLWNSFDLVCSFISYLMVLSDLRKSVPFKSYGKNIEWPSKKFLIKMSVFVLPRYVCYEYWAMWYEVFLKCYNRNPMIIFLQ